MLDSIICALNSIRIFLATNLLELSTLSVAGASFYVSWLTYKRDSGRLDVSVLSSELRNGTTLALEQKGLHIKIVNSGRRPLIVSSIGGDAKWQKFHWIAMRLFGHRTPSWLTPTSFLVSDPAVTNHLAVNGQYKTLHEGQDISIFLPFPQADELFKLIATKCSSFYVFDSIGRKHRASKGMLKKLTSDYYKNDQAPSDSTSS